MTPKPRIRWTPEDKTKALHVLALAGGNSVKASALLHTQDMAIGQRLLRDWKLERADEYARICEHRAPEIERSAAHLYRELVHKAVHVQEKALDQALIDLEDGKVRDASAMAKNAAVTGGISVEKVLQLTDRPTQVIETRSGQEIMAAMARRRGIMVDSTATEIPTDQQQIEP